MSRWANAMRMNGVDADLLTREQVRHLAPDLDMSSNARYPILGGLSQARAGTARHDAVAWGYARGASALGVTSYKAVRFEALSRSRFDRGRGHRLGRVRRRRGGHRRRWTQLGVRQNWQGFDCRSRAMRCKRWSASPVKPKFNTLYCRRPSVAYIQPVGQGRNGDWGRP